MRVRDFSAETDIDILSEAEEEAHRASPPGVTFPIGSVQSRLSMLQSGQCIAFSLEEGAAVGCIVLSPDTNNILPIGYIDCLFIRSEFRGQGGLELLLNHAAAYFRSLGIRYMRLEVSALNERAIRAYERFGFVTTQHTMDVSIGS